MSMILNPMLLATSFNPLSIDGCVMWIKPDLGGYTNNQLISSIPDYSANSYTYANAGGSARPTYKANEVNGKGVLRFAGSQWLFNNTLVVTGPATVFAALKPTSSAEMNYVATSSTSSGGNTSPFFNTSYRNSLYDGQTVINGETVTASTWGVATVRIGGPGVPSVLQWNTGTKTTGGYNPTAPKMNGVSIGSWTQQAPNNWVGDIAEILIYDPHVSDEDQDRIRDYMLAGIGL